MTDSKDLSEQDAVVAEVDIAAPPERVFEALTEANQLFAWWSTEPSVELSLCEMDARLGGRWRFKGRPAPGSDHGDVGVQLKRNAAQEFELLAKCWNTFRRAFWCGAGLQTATRIPRIRQWSVGS